jgi:ABC-type nitrate/sulfonate/bicarbonate transport system substrate-binding protein
LPSSTTSRDNDPRLLRGTSVGSNHIEEVMIRLAVPDMISPSYFPAIAAVELGVCRDLGLDVALDLVFPVTRTYERLRDGDLDYVAGAAHAALYAFERWAGVKLLCALSHHMYWFLVVRSDLGVQRGDLPALRGLRIGAAPGPDDGLRVMLVDAGIDPDDVEIGPVPGTADHGVSFGVTAAEALERGEIDGFWANGMGAEVAVRRRVGTLIVDARRGDGTPGARDFTFPALSTTSIRARHDKDEASAMTRAIVQTQRALKANPSLAGSAVEALFPDFEASLISELVRRDAPYYDPTITDAAIGSMSEFAKRLGLPTSATSLEELVPSFAAEVWVK